MKMCELDSHKVCDDCGECEYCEFDSTKKCDNCMMCITGGATSMSVNIDTIIKPSSPKMTYKKR